MRPPLWAHVLVHLLVLFGAGFVFAASLRGQRALVKALFLIAAEALMWVLGLALISGALVYPGYPPSGSRVVGIAMVIGMELTWVLLAALSALGEGRSRTVPTGKDGR